MRTDYCRVMGEWSTCVFERIKTTRKSRIYLLFTEVKLRFLFKFILVPVFIFSVFVIVFPYNHAEPEERTEKYYSPRYD